MFVGVRAIEDPHNQIFVGRHSAPLDPHGIGVYGPAQGPVQWRPKVGESGGGNQVEVCKARRAAASGPNDRNGVWVLASEPPPHQLRGLGQHCKPRLPKGFWATVTSNGSPYASGSLSCLSVTWPNGWMDQDAT